MLEFLVAASVIAVLLALVGRPRPGGSSPVALGVEPPGEVDLPCPWCRSPTREDDRACPGCGRSFGP